jgi:hypothetical protein
VNGTDFLVYVDDGTGPILVGSQRNATVDESNEEIDLSSKNQREAVVDSGRYSATLSLEALYVPTDAGYQALVDAIRNATPVTVVAEENGVYTESAQEIGPSLSREYPDQGEATISCELKISGAWMSGT